MARLDAFLPKNPDAFIAFIVLAGSIAGRLRPTIARNISFAENQQADGKADLVKPDAECKAQICDKVTNATSEKPGAAFSKDHAETNARKCAESAIAIPDRAIKMNSCCRIATNTLSPVIPEPSIWACQ